MSVLQAIILGIIEGVTEFLPISSTGHLILGAQLLQIPETEFLKSFEIIIQLAAILAVVVLYWRTLFLSFDMIKKIVVAFVPTGIIGLVFYPLVKDVLLESESIVVISLILGGIFIILFEQRHKEKPDASGLNDITYTQAFLIGIFQAVAIIPGVSRAAATIIGGLILGLNRRAIVEFSFLLAVPTMAAATGLDLIKSADNFSSSDLGVLFVGFVAAFITAVLSIKFLLRFINTHKFTSFGIYRIVVAALFWLLVMRV